MTQYARHFDRWQNHDFSEVAYARCWNELATEVKNSGKILVWDASREAPATGSFLLLAVATWSESDLKLLDAIQSSPKTPDAIGIMNADDFEDVSKIQARFPGIGDACQFPLAGYWIDGQLIECAFGFAAQDLALRVCGLNIDSLTDRDIILSSNSLPCPAPTTASSINSAP